VNVTHSPKARFVAVLSIVLVFTGTKGTWGALRPKVNFADVTISSTGIPVAKLQSSAVPNHGHEDFTDNSFFFEVDLFPANNAINTEAMMKQLSSEADSPSVGSFTGTSKTTFVPSFGLGYFFPVANPHSNPRCEMGWGANYIDGPNVDSNITHTVSSDSNETTSSHLRTEIARVVGLIRGRWAMNQSVEFRLRAGAGIALTYMTNNFDQTIQTAPSSGVTYSPFSGSKSRNHFGFTMDVGPSVAFSMRRVNMEVGAVFLYVPTEGAIDNFPEFKWHPVGLRTTIEF